MAAITAEQAGGDALVRFLDLIAFAEGTSTSPHTQNDGYDVVVNGLDGHHEFTDYSDHPFAGGRPGIVFSHSPGGVSTAAGRYQLLAKYFPIYKQQLHLPDFGPVSQDRIALQQIREKHAIADILAGNIESAVQKLCLTWTSFPGNDYHQGGGKDMAALLGHYEILAAPAAATAPENA
jgi:muramidase (phage lysozyme)